MVATLEDLGNPWLEKSGKLYDLETRLVMSDEVVNNIRNIKKTGLAAYHEFLNKRVFTQEEALTDPIPACNLKLIRHELEKKSAKINERSLASDIKGQQVKLIDIISAHEAGRPNLAEEVLSHESSPYPPTLTTKGSMFHCCKSDILKVIAPDDVRYKDPPDSPTTIILDAPVIIQQRKPNGCDTIRDYVDKIIWPELLDLFEKYDRIEWVSDIWSKTNIKSALRDSRGAGRTRIVDANTKIPKDWREFMQDEENKTQLFPVIGTLLIDKPIPEVYKFSSHSNLISKWLHLNMIKYIADRFNFYQYHSYILGKSAYCFHWQASTVQFTGCFHCYSR